MHKTQNKTKNLYPTINCCIKNVRSSGTQLHMLCVACLSVCPPARCLSDLPFIQAEILQMDGQQRKCCVFQTFTCNPLSFLLFVIARKYWVRDGWPGSPSDYTTRTSDDSATDTASILGTIGDNVSTRRKV
jgi:hypothetical protein